MIEVGGTIGMVEEEWGMIEVGGAIGVVEVEVGVDL